MSKMTIRECMDAALQLLNQYSITNDIVPLTYNDQADTEKRMINLINDAQMQIATTVKPIEEFIKYTVKETDHGKGSMAVVMPEDFDKVSAIYFSPKDDDRFSTVDADQYKWVGGDTLLVPADKPGVYRIVYSRYPERYAANEDQSKELDNGPDTHEIIPYFVAAMIAVDQNPKMYFALYNVWETRLSRLNLKQAHAVSTQIADVYGLSDFGGIW